MSRIVRTGSRVSLNIGGFAAIGGHVAALHEEHGDDRVLVLDGGDVMTGTPLMEFEVRGARGGAMLDLMETAGMDAWVLGNHEFDIGFDHISRIVSASQVPVLSANLDATDGSGAPAIMGVQDHTIFERNGLRVGVFGLTTTSLGRLTASDAAARMDVRGLAEVAREQVAVLEPQVDLVIRAHHVGLEEDKALAEEVEGIDLIVGGHSHTSWLSPSGSTTPGLSRPAAMRATRCRGADGGVGSHRESTPNCATSIRTRLPRIPLRLASRRPGVSGSRTTLARSLVA